jgi:hypothetical protein
MMQNLSSTALNLANAHFDGDTLCINPSAAFQLGILIDNQDRDEAPEVPYTLNTFLGADADYEDNALYIDGGCIIATSVPDALRQLADAIESGRVAR